VIQDRIARFVQSSTPSESFEDLALAAATGFSTAEGPTAVADAPPSALDEVIK
jgi:hypothetical protein